MAEGNDGVIIIQIPEKAVALTEQAQQNRSDAEIRFYNWLVKQPLAVEAAIYAAYGSVTGAALGAIPVWLQVSTVTQLVGSKDAISCIMKRLRGKEDLLSSVVAGFGSTALFSLASGAVEGPNPEMDAVAWGICGALVNGLIFKLREKPPQPRAEDVYYNKTRSMLNNLGLQKYEKNFKNGTR